MPNEVLKREIQKRGGVKAVAEALNVTPSAVYYWISGEREPSDNLLKYLGLERRVRLVRKQEQAA